jgi:hypothetical protein
MRKYLVCLIAVALAACGVVPPGSTTLPPPSEIANTTVLDEKAAIAIETGYKAFRTAVEIAVDSGQLKGEKAARVAVIDNKINAAVIRVEQAYRAANSSSYTAAVLEAKSLVEEGIAIMRSR